MDERKLSFVCGVDISFLGDKEQYWILDAINDGISISAIQSAQIKDYYKEKKLNEVLVRHILSEEKPKARRFTLKADSLSRFFDDDISDEEIEETILRALEEYLAKDRTGGCNG